MRINRILGLALLCATWFAPHAFATDLFQSDSLTGAGFGTDDFDTNPVFFWVDANDIDGDGMEGNNPSTGTNLADSASTGWRDKSGFGIHLSNGSGTVTVSETEVLGVGGTRVLRPAVFFPRGLHILESEGDSILTRTNRQLRDFHFYVVMSVVGAFDEPQAIFNLIARAGSLERITLQASAGEDGYLSSTRFRISAAFINAPETPVNFGVITLIRAEHEGTLPSASGNNMFLHSNGALIGERRSDQSIRYNGTETIMLGGSITAPSNAMIHFNGFINEVIFFQEALARPAAELLENYLAIKWGVTLATSADLLDLPIVSNFTTGFEHDFSGIGRTGENDILDNTLSGGLELIGVAGGQGFLEDGTGRYVTVSHDNGRNNAIRRSVGVQADRTWYADVRGSDGALSDQDLITLEFTLGEIGFNLESTPTNAGDYALLVSTPRAAVNTFEVRATGSSYDPSDGGKVQVRIDADRLAGRSFTLSLPLQVNMTADRTSLIEGETAQLTFRINASRPVPVNLRLELDTDEGVKRLGGVLTGQDISFTDLFVTIPPGTFSVTRDFVTLDDPFAEAVSQERVRVFLSSVSGGQATAGSSTRVEFTISDNDTAAINVAPLNLTMAEDGAADSFEITLGAAPEDSNVVLSVTNNSPALQDISQAELTFQPFYWQSTQTITVTGIGNRVDDGDRTGMITVAVVSTQTNPSFRGLGPWTIQTTIVDNDEVELRPQVSSLAINEGASGLLRIRLGSAPPEDGVFVNAALTSMPFATEFAGGGQMERLTFNRADWDVFQELSVVNSGNNFPTAGSGNVVFSINTQLTAQGTGYRNVSPQTVQLTFNDDDVPGFSLNRSSVRVEEDRGQFFIRAALEAQPLPGNEVVLDLSVAGTAATVSPSELVFNDVNWNLLQAFQVVGMPNRVIGDLETTLTVSVNRARSYDPFDTVPSRRLPVVVVDDEVPGVSLSTSVITIDEGSSFNLEVELQVAPMALVRVQLASSEPDEITLDNQPSVVLELTPSNWDTGVPVAVLAVDDGHVNIDQARITASVLTGSDAVYLGVRPRIAEVTVRDDELPSFMLSTSSLTIAENGGTGIFEVSLGLPPAEGSPVVISFASEDTREALVSPMSVVFTGGMGGNWNVPQAIAVTAVDDFNLYNDSTTINVTVNRAATAAVPYTFLDTQTVSITLASDDVAEFALSPRQLFIGEGRSRPYSLRAVSFPPSTATVRIAAVNGLSFDHDGGMSGGNNQPIDIPFTTRDTQTITVSVIDDNLFEGDRTYEIRHSVSSANPDFNTAVLPSLQVNASNENDLSTVRFVGSTGTIRESTGTDAQVTTHDVFLELSNPSTSSITVEVLVVGEAGLDEDYMVATSLTVEFDPREVTANHPIRLVSLDDQAFEGPETISLAIQQASGGAAIDFANAMYEVTIEDNETPPLVSLQWSNPRSTIIGEVDEMEEVFIHLTGVTSSSVVVQLAVSLTATVGSGNTPAEPSDYSLNGMVGAQNLVVVVPRDTTRTSVTFRTIPDLEGDDLEELSIWIRSVTNGMADPNPASNTLSITITEDVTPPGNLVGLLVDQITGGTARVNWASATDNRTAQADLNYRVHIADRPFTASTGTDGYLTARAEAFSSIPVPRRTTNTTVTRLLPLRDYYVTVEVDDGNQNFALYSTNGLRFQTINVDDVDADGLPDYLESLGGVGPRPSSNNLSSREELLRFIDDLDGDGLSDDLEQYLSGGVSATSVPPNLDRNGNFIPDAHEVSIGLYADAETANEIIGGGLRPVVIASSPEVSVVNDIGLFTAIAVTATRSVFSQLANEEGARAVIFTTATVGSTPVVQSGGTRLTAYLRSGPLCGGDVLPANYDVICTEVRKNADGELMLRPGHNRLWWIAEDRFGNWPLGGAVRQTINVLTEVNFLLDQTIPLASEFTISAQLSGNPPVLNGFDLPFLVTVNTTDDRPDLAVNSTGVISFPAGSRVGSSLPLTSGTLAGEIEFQFNTASDEFVPLGTGAGAVVEVSEGRLVVLGSNSTVHVVRSTAADLPISFALEIRDINARPITTVDVSAVNVLEMRTVLDREAVLLLTYDWTATDQRLNPGERGSVSRIRFNPAFAQQGLYSVQVSVGDGENIAHRSRVMRLLSAEDLPTSRNIDRDGDNVPDFPFTDLDLDGLPDAAEGFFDQDGDAIPDYLDTLTFDANVLQGYREEGQVPDVTQFLLKTQPQLRLRLGATALAAASLGNQENSFTARVTLDDLRAFGDMGSPPQASVDVDAPNANVGIYDFSVDDLPEAGSLAQVVLPMRNGLPNRPEYRKFTPDLGWRTFELTGRESAQSVMGERGECPGPEEAIWDTATGLTEGHYCIRLTIEDGGPNDADGLVNRSVSDPGGVGSAVVSGVSAGEEGDGSPGGGGGCGLARAGVSVSPGSGLDVMLVVLLLGSCGLWLFRRRWRGSCYALGLLFPLCLFSGEGLGQGWSEWQEWEGDRQESLEESAALDELESSRKALLERQDRSRWHVGVGFGRTSIVPEVAGDLRVTKDSDTGSKLVAGYRLSRHLDLGFFWWDVGTAEVAGPQASGRLRYRELGLELVFSGLFPGGHGERGELSGWRLGWYGQLGVSDQDVKTGLTLTSNEELQGVLGLGLELRTSARWRVRLGVEQYGKDVGLVSLSWLLGGGGWRNWLYAEE